jgi:CheY-like chemotaxis protein
LSKAAGRDTYERRLRSGGGSRRLLVLDHDAWSRALADGLLRGRGYRVVCTGDPEMAVRLAREMLPDLVLADLSTSVLEAVPARERRSADPDPTEILARVDEGYALLRPLEVAPAGAQLPVVLLKARKEGGQGLDGSRFGVVASLRKPFTPESLLGRVEEVLGGPHRPADEAARRNLEEDGFVLGGRIEIVGVPGILQMCHQGTLSGVCTLESPEGNSTKVYFRKGEIVAASSTAGVRDKEAVVDVVSWSRGRFDFVPGEPEERKPLGAFEALILEGCRRMDERERFGWRPYPARRLEPKTEA